MPFGAIWGQCLIRCNFTAGVYGLQLAREKKVWPARHGATRDNTSYEYEYRGTVQGTVCCDGHMC